MKLYISCELIEAESLSRGDYNKLRGWNIPKDENPLDEGYLVRHNSERMSWIPKEEFEKYHFKLESDKDDIEGMVAWEYEEGNEINNFKGKKITSGFSFGYLLGGTYDISDVAENENELKEIEKEQDTISIDIFHALLEFALHGFNYRNGDKEE